MGERGQDPREDLRGEHPWAKELLGPYVLGALDLEEEREVGRHIAECAACQEEERGLRETHERLVGFSVAVSSAPPHLKEQVLAALPPHDRSGMPTGATRNPSWFTSRVGRLMVAAAIVLLMAALPAVAYSSGFFDRVRTSTLAPTGLAPEAGGGLTVRGSGPNVEANLEVWGLPRAGPDEYYELWFGKNGGRVSAGTFAVDPEGHGKLSGSVPQLEGDYQSIDVTLEKLPEEPRMSSAQIVLQGDLREP